MSSQDPASTTTALPADLSNRREIPVSAFDFLDGAYRKEALTRRVVVALAATMLAATVATLGLSAPNWTASARAQSQVESVRQEREMVFSELGSAPGVAVSVEDLIARHDSLSRTYRELLILSPALDSVLETMDNNVTRSTLSRVDIGYSPQLAQEVPVEAGAEADASVRRHRFRITLTSGDIALAAADGLALRQEPFLTITKEARSGTSGIAMQGVERSTVSAAVRTRLDELALPAGRVALLDGGD